VIADLEDRYRELKEQAAQMEADPAIRFPCRTCRWADTFEAAWCHQPLVKGFGERVHMGMDRGGLVNKAYPALCGPEKALWEPVPAPKRNYQLLWEWLLRRFGFALPPVLSAPDHAIVAR
jgi:hypothetical protein